MIVMKFGGTSVEDSAAIERAADIVRGRLEQRPVVVVSALAGVTDSLLAMSQAAASRSLLQATELLRQVQQRRLVVLSALVSGADEAAVRERIHKLADVLRDVLRGVATLADAMLSSTCSGFHSYCNYCKAKTSLY